MVYLVSCVSFRSASYFDTYLLSNTKYRWLVYLQKGNFCNFRTPNMPYLMRTLPFTSILSQGKVVVPHFKSRGNVALTPLSRRSRIQRPSSWRRWLPSSRWLVRNAIHELAQGDVVGKGHVRSGWFTLSGATAFWITYLLMDILPHPKTFPSRASYQYTPHLECISRPAIVLSNEFNTT